jgi:NitT/TauT family transport system permease protein
MAPARKIAMSAVSHAAPILILAVVWELAARSGLLPAYVLPPLSQVFVRFVTLLHDELPRHIAYSMYRVAAGLGLAVSGGVLLGLLMARLPTVHFVMSPLLRSLYPLPKTALIPLIILWFGLGDSAKIALIFLGCLLPVVVGTYNSAREVDRLLVWSARFLGASEQRVVRDIIVPAALPHILNGIRTALALAFILVISAELIMAQNGIGYLIHLLGDGGDYAGMFAGILTISVIGFLADTGFMALTRRFVFWTEAENAF